jgi:hypothetical protein
MASVTTAYPSRSSPCALSRCSPSVLRGAGPCAGPAAAAPRAWVCGRPRRHAGGLRPRKQVEGQKVTDSAMKQAVSIIRQRVNAFGVSEAESQRAGSGRELPPSSCPIPGKTNSDVIDSLKSNAAKLDVPPGARRWERQLQRLVKPGSTATPAPTPTAVERCCRRFQSATDDAAFRAAYAKLDCTAKGALVGGVPVDPTKFVATCDREGVQKYVLVSTGARSLARRLPRPRRNCRCAGCRRVAWSR